jgi:hypothetical protein
MSIAIHASAGVSGILNPYTGSGILSRQMITVSTAAHRE